MPWLELADLPFAAALRPHPGGLALRGDYDCAHFDQAVFDGADAASARFLECAFTRVTFQGGGLRGSRLTDVWLRDVRLTGTDLAETSWTDSVLVASAAAGVEAFGSQLRRVTFQGCKLDSVNFRDAVLTEVTFDDCLLREVDFSGATLTDTAFPRSRLAGTTFARMTLHRVDLRDAELGITTDTVSLRGASITTAQLGALARLLADSMGIIVAEDRDAHDAG
jgi:uncharacterized protein YjbI with pentapeptide repeats